MIILFTLLSLKQSVNQLHLNETIDLTISELVFSLSCYVWKQSKMLHEKDLLQYIICAGNCCNVLLLGPATIKAHVYACDVHRWHFSCVVNSWTLPLYGFWLWIMSAGIITLIKNQECRHQQDDCASMLLIIASDCCNHFLAIAHSMQYHCYTGRQDFHRMSCHRFDVTSPQ